MTWSKLRRIFVSRRHAIDWIPQLPLFNIRDLRWDNRSRNEAQIRACCNAVPVTTTQVLARVLGHYKLYVSPSDYGLSPHLMLDGFWEMSTTEAIVECLRPGMIAADIGANVGYFSMLMADLVGPQGRVFAFEPNPEMAERIERSSALNAMTDRLTVYPLGLAEAAKAVCFVMPSDEPKNAYILPFINNEVPTGAVVIDVDRLDSRPEWRDIEFLKIDAEGAEQNIWEGASGLREKDRLKTIILEFRADRYQDAAAFLEDIMNWGFTLEWIHETKGIQPTSISAVLAKYPKEDVMLVFRR